MDNLQYIGLILAPLILCGIFIKPQILLYFLVIDSWLIIRISQGSFFHPALSFNRIIVYIGLVVIVLKRLRCRNFVPKAARTLITLFVSFLLLYCFCSYYTYTYQFNFSIINNLIFYFLALALLDQELEKSFLHICIIAVIPVFLLSSSSIINAVIHMDIGQRSFAGNRIHSSFKILLGLSFLYALREILIEKTVQRIAITMIIVVGTLAVALSLGRMVTIILFVTIVYYFLRSYITSKVLLSVALIVTLFATIQYTTMATYIKKLIRVPSSADYNILE